MADCILIQGEVVVDEGVLTGESIPIRKQKIGGVPRVSSVLLTGSKCLMVKDDPIAVVQATGARSMKGQLARTILFMKEPGMGLHTLKHCASFFCITSRDPGHRMER